MTAAINRPPVRTPPRERGKPYSTDRQLGLIRFSPCGKFLVAGDFTGQVVRWDASGDTLRPLPDLAGHHGWVQALAFHPDGKRLFTADSWGRLAAWPFTDREPRPTWVIDPAHAAWIRRLVVSPDGALLATCSSDGVVRVWSSDRGAKRQEWLVDRDVLSVTWRPDGKAVVFGDLRGDIHEHDVASGKRLRRLQAPELYRLDRIQEVGGVRCLVFDGAGTTLAAAGCHPTSGGFVQGTPRLVYFDAGTGKVRQALEFGTTNDGYVLDLHWHAEGYVAGVTSGQPGQGKLFLHWPGEPAPFFVTTKMGNCHSLTMHGRRIVVAATNANSSGNGRPKTADRSYPGNTSPLYFWELPETSG